MQTHSTAESQSRHFESEAQHLRQEIELVTGQLREQGEASRQKVARAVQELKDHYENEVVPREVEAVKHKSERELDRKDLELKRAQEDKEQAKEQLDVLKGEVEKCKDEAN